MAAGLKRMAILTAPTGPGKLVHEDAAAAMVKHGLSMRIFSSVPPATTWALTGLDGI